MSQRTIRVGIIQQHNTADIQQNIALLEKRIHSLSSKGAQLVVLQELHNTTYFCQEENTDNFDMASPIPGKDTDFFSQIAKECGIVLVTSLFERRSAGLYHNTAVVIDADGSICGRYRKMHIPDDPGYYEKFYFCPGDTDFEPINTSIGRLGVMVCWDQWYPEAARIMALRGAEILIYPTAIGYDANDDSAEQERQRDAWITVQRGHAIANGLPLVAVNRVGFEPHPTNHNTGIHFWGSSFVAGPQGEMLFCAPKDQEAIETIDLSLSRSEQVRRWWPFLRDRRIDAFSCISKRFDD